MAALSAKLRSIEWHGRKGISFWCPGCDGPHAVNVGGDGTIVLAGMTGNWEWDGNVDAPTLSPSIRVQAGNPSGRPPSVCHSFVRAGQIEFLGDCTHALKGQTVPLPDWPTHERKSRDDRPN